MNIEEATYWKNYIDMVINGRLDNIETSDADALKIVNFAHTHMQTINGQQMLPQGTFREFLNLFAHLPVLQKEIEEAQLEIFEWLENIPVECSTKEVEHMFDGEMVSDDSMWLPSMDIDTDGDVALNIIVDVNGNAYFVD